MGVASAYSSSFCTYHLKDYKITFTNPKFISRRVSIIKMIKLVFIICDRARGKYKERIRSEPWLFNEELEKDTHMKWTPGAASKILFLGCYCKSILLVKNSLTHLSCVAFWTFKIQLFEWCFIKSVNTYVMLTSFQNV